MAESGCLSVCRTPLLGYDAGLASIQLTETLREAQRLVGMNAALLHLTVCWQLMMNLAFVLL